MGGVRPRAFAAVVTPLTLMVAALLSMPARALAHVPIAGVNGFTGGLLHPILVPSHAMAIVGLGLLISRHDPAARVAAFVAFAAAVIAGLLALYFGTGDIFAGDILLATTIVIGVALAVARLLPQPLLGALALIAGGSLALDSPPDVISIREATRILIGTGFGACIALSAVITGASLVTRDWQRIAVRIAGSWIAASGILVLAVDLVAVLR